MEADPVETLRPLLRSLLSRDVVGFAPTTAGLTHAVTGVARLDDGRSVFVKAGLDEHSRPQVRTEIANLAWLGGSFMPQVLATSLDPPVLVIEDLSRGHWPEPYPRDVGLLESALSELRSIPVPSNHSLEMMEPPGEEILGRLVDDAGRAVPSAAGWVANHVDDIRAALDSIGPATALVHSDLWYPNICFLPERVVLVDWSHLSVGSPWFDASTVSVDLVIEGRPPLTMEEGAGWAAAHTAWVVWALAKGPAPSISDPDLWTSDNLELFDGAAWWLAHELGIEPPPRVTKRAVGWM